MNTYDIGDVVTITGTFTVSGVPTDPTTVTLTITHPDGTTEAHTGTGGGLTNPSIGTWKYNHSTTMAGVHAAQLVGTGAAASSEPDRFYVRANATV